MGFGSVNKGVVIGGFSSVSAYMSSAGSGFSAGSGYSIGSSKGYSAIPLYNYIFVVKTKFYNKDLDFLKKLLNLPI